MTPPAVTDGDIERLFAIPVCACVASSEMAEAPLAPGELARVAHAVPSRRAEFAAGRAAARVALQRLGLEAVIIPSQDDRSPLWPAGHVGSLSHCEGFCAAVATTTRYAAGLGFDAEPAQPLPEDVAAMVCSRSDSSLTGPELRAHPLWPTLVFSAKEAAYKCQYPLSKAVLGFEAAAVLAAGSIGDGGGDLAVQFGPAAPAFLGALEFRGAWRLSGGLVLTGMWVAPLERN